MQANARVATQFTACRCGAIPSTSHTCSPCGPQDAVELAGGVLTSAYFDADDWDCFFGNLAETLHLIEQCGGGIMSQVEFFTRHFPGGTGGYGGVRRSEILVSTKDTYVYTQDCVLVIPRTPTPTTPPSVAESE